MDRDLTQWTAADMLQGLNRRDFSSAELVAAHIQRIEQVNPELNAMTHFRFEQAVMEAKAADEHRLRRMDHEADERPLLGMPITVKEIYRVKGLPITGGVRKHQHRIAQVDAAVVECVRRAGAIVLGKTNTSTLTMTHETDNVVFGRTNHPLDPTRTPGGSSGGEAAIIAAHGSPWGIGSDLGGSIRLPAHFCGIVGMRASYQRISTDGEYPFFPHHRHMNSAGPLARTVEDVRILYEVLTGRPVSETLQREDTTWFWLDEIPGAPLQTEIRQGLERAAVALTKSGVSLEAVPKQLLQGAHALWEDIILSERGKPFASEIQETNEFSLPLEIIRSLRGNSTYHPWILQVILGGQLFYPRRHARRSIQARVDELRRRFSSVIGVHGVLLLPVFPWTAPAHGRVAQMVHTKRGSRILPYLVFANALGYPAMSIPAGATPDGFPFGLQVMADLRQEQRILGAARRIESALQGS